MQVCAHVQAACLYRDLIAAVNGDPSEQRGKAPTCALFLFILTCLRFIRNLNNLAKNGEE